MGTVLKDRICTVKHLRNIFLKKQRSNVQTQRWKEAGEVGEEVSTEDQNICFSAAPKA